MTDTLPKLLMESYKELGESNVAMRRKNYGIWINYTWKDYFENVKYFCLGLIKLGLKQGSKLAVIGENDPEWVWSALAVQAARGSTVGIFPDSSVAEAKYVVDHSESVFVVAEDQEQTDKILEIKKQGSDIRGVIYWDRKGMYTYTDPSIIFFYDVIELGRKYEMSHKGIFEKMVQEGVPDDIGVICYTSGTTGKHQKGAMLSQKLLVKLGEIWSSVDPWEQGDDYLSYLSPAWGTEWQLGVSTGLRNGAVLCFAERPETMQRDLREIGPKVVFYSSKMWESVNSLIQVKIADTYRIERYLFNLFLPVGYKIADLRAQKKVISLFWRVMYQLAEWSVFKQLRDKIGLRNIKWAYTGGAGISPDIVRFFHAIGINLKSCYGSTETMMISLTKDGSVNPETSGEILPGYDVKISEDDGEVLVNPPVGFAGYLKDPEKTNDIYNEEGYMKTGDAGFMTEEGHLVIMDRVDFLMELSNGRKFSPDYIENRLRSRQYIDNAMCIGGLKKEYICVFIVINFDNTANWAEKKRISYTSFADLSQKPQVSDLMLGIIKDVNETLPDWARIEKFLILNKELDPDEGELTRTRKLKRGVMGEKYKDLITSLYTDAREVMAEIPILYKDGRTGVSKVTLKIRNVR